MSEPGHSQRYKLACAHFEDSDQTAPAQSDQSLRWAFFSSGGKLKLRCLFVCFVALRPKPTAMVMAGRSVHLTTLFPGQA